jgi:5-hydroxyisourate hydrolase
LTKPDRVSISTHVLDTSLGQPAAGVPVSLDRRDESTWINVASGETDNDGRARALIPDDQPAPAGTYRLVFDTGWYFTRSGVDAFYPSVTVVFDTRGGGGHYHVPLLLSPFGYSTYRGS